MILRDKYTETLFYIFEHMLFLIISFNNYISQKIHLLQRNIQNKATFTVNGYNIKGRNL